MPFRFKQFSVEDDKSTMKVGTDAVVLGAWVNVSDAKSILDIGTGCGLIALMLAQRTNDSDASVDAVEIDKESAIQAEENFKKSPWPIRIFNTSIQKFEHAPYDLIVSNPPFFSKSLLPPKDQRKLARHTDTLSFDELFECADRLLAPTGRFAVIVPEPLRTPRFYCIRETVVYTRAGNKPERYLLEFSRQEKIPVKDNLILLDGDKRSLAYENLAKDFYLGTF